MMHELKESIERIRTSRNRAFSSEREFSEEMLEIRKAFVTIHGEMVLLKNYSSLNFAGLVKILKKYDKRTGGWLSLPFSQRALHQPFFTTEPLTRLVHECEANLELLFPLEPEVVEPNQDEAHQQRNPEVSPIRADFVYRSTLAALRAIQGLRRASSTYNPLSLAQFFHGEGADNEYGAVTSENSTSNSLTTSQNNEADYGTDD
ncbi:hypothetical protein ZIOFF_069835 [Zingiber officinale]|uniref:SPX domain-containing protein n=1 Tax=Zingiber officinale TaxID=94328 RepID=A0A8J5C4N9_ZINOF|nr:hypothetical protein ZIOFF_069835 [Zingiber officinale]